MPVSCSAYGCTVRHSRDKDISFFRFPLKNKELTKKWADNMKRDNWYPTRNSIICSLHFEEKYMYMANSRRRLLANAVPTLFNFSPPTRRRKRKSIGSTPKKRLRANSPETDSDDSSSINMGHPKKCMVCGISSRVAGSRRSFFGIPKDPQRCRAWLKAIDRLDLLDNNSEDNIHDSYKICSLHFDEWCFNNTFRNRIIKSGVPTLELQANPAVDISSDSTANKKSSASHFGQTCAVYGCKSNGSSDAVSFYRFPLDKLVCSQWVEKCTRSDLDEVFQLHGAPYMNCVYRICSRHFKPSDFGIPGQRKFGVKLESVPSLNLRSSKNVAEDSSDDVQREWQESDIRIVSVISQKDSTDALEESKSPDTLSESGNQDDDFPDFIAEDVPGTIETKVVECSLPVENVEVVCEEHSYAAPRAQKQCRLCAHDSPDFVPIFTSDGITQKLAEKIDKYLPIQVSPRDELPLDVCLSCLKMLNVCHELVTGCVKADEKLRSALKSKPPQVEADEDDDHNTDWLDMGGMEDIEVDEQAQSKADVSSLDRISKKEDVPSFCTPLVVGDVTGSFVEVVIGNADEDTTGNQSEQEETVAAGLRKLRKLLPKQDAKEKSSTDSIPSKNIVAVAGTKAQSVLKTYAGKGKGADKVVSTADQGKVLLLPIQQTQASSTVAVATVGSQFAPSTTRSEDSEAEVPSKGSEEALSLAHITMEVPTDLQCMCPICSRVSRSEETFKRHLLLKHTKSLLQCKKCSTVLLASEESLTIHRFSCPRKHLIEISETGKITKSPSSGNIESQSGVLSSEQSKHHDSKNMPKVDSDTDDISDSETAVFSEASEKALSLPHVKIEVAGDSQYTCPICSEVSESGKNFKRHLLLEHSGSLLQCKECSTILPASEESLTELCFLCKIKALSEDSEITKYHLSVSKETNGEPPTSEQSKEEDSKNVSKVYSNVTDVNDLLSKFPNFAVVKVRRVSEGIEILRAIEINVASSCKQCNENFPSRKELRKHKSKVHPVSQICQFCGKYLHDASTLKRHEETHKHTHFCEKCNETIVGEAEVRRHIRCHVEKKYKCLKCGKQFRTWNCLLQHNQIHNNSNPHLCEICGKSFKRIQSLYEHGYIHKKKFPCSYCDKYLTTESKRQRHQRSHTGERPFECSICNKAFTSKSCLKQHEAIHAEERPYECDICGKKWKRLHNMIYHKKKHFDQPKEKQVICKICKDAFPDLKTLYSHRNSHTTEDIDQYKRLKKNRKECSICHEFPRNKAEYEEHMLSHAELN